MGIINRPIITEKVTDLGENLNKYAFSVSKTANKVEVKKAIEEMYGVTVLAVNTMNYSGKSKRNRKTGLNDGRTNAFKKAIITLKEGDVIDFYSNI